MINFDSFLDELDKIKQAYALSPGQVAELGAFSGGLGGVVGGALGPVMEPTPAQRLRAAVGGGLGGALGGGAITGGLAALGGAVGQRLGGAAGRDVGQGIGMAVGMPLGAVTGVLGGVAATATPETKKLMEAEVQAEQQLMEEAPDMDPAFGYGPYMTRFKELRQKYLDEAAAAPEKTATPRLLMDLLGKGSKASSGAKPLISTEGKILGTAGIGGGVVAKGEFDKYMLGRRIHEAQNR